MKAGWQTSTLGESCELYQPKTISAKEMVENGAYPVFGANGEIGRYDKYNHEEPQLLVTCRGATCGAVNVSKQKSWITGNSMVVRPKGADLDLHFLEYLLRGGVEISKAITGAAQPQITRTNLAPIEIRYPQSLPEQRRIVGILDEAFEGLSKAVDHAEANLNNARELFESHLNAIFSNPGPDWTDSVIEKHINFIDYRGRTPKKTESGMRLITAKNVKMGFLQIEPQEFVDPSIYESWMTRGIPKKGDVLFTTEAPLGNVAQLDTDDRVVFAQRVIIMQPNETELDSTFLKYMLLSGLMQNRIHERGTGATAKGIKASLLKKVEIAFPVSLDEQQATVSKLDELAAETKRLEAIYRQKLALLDELKQSLLHKAFSGEL